MAITILIIMPYEIWNEILEILSQEPDRIFSLDDLEEETRIDRTNLQQALYRAYRRDDVERIAPGMYRFHDKYRGQKNDVDTSNSDAIHIKEREYEISIQKPNLRVIDEMIGQLKYIRKQIKRNR
jgi:predicted transcriptional regulator of viral defense system